jgi:hypothetical protein
VSQPRFKNIAELAEWLAAAGIDTASWGQGVSKQLTDLWQEYQGGETRFVDDPAARQVKVVEVVIRRDDFILVETEQVFRDGRRRLRMRPPSEKIKGGEAPRAAALRCLREELGVAQNEVALGEKGQRTEQSFLSPSYPGLPTHYTFYTFEAFIDKLPDADFYIDNRDPDDPIRRHQWGWRREEID